MNYTICQMPKKEHVVLYYKNISILYKSAANASTSTTWNLTNNTENILWFFLPQKEDTMLNHICKMNCKSKYIQISKFPIFNFNVKVPEMLLFTAFP